MWLTRVFLERWPLTIVLVCLTTLFGVVSAKSLIIQRLPNTGQPTVGMRLTYSGASTTELRDTIARPVEDQIAGAQDLLHVDTSVQTGSATIASYFSLGSSASADLTAIVEAFTSAQSQLPSDLVAPNIRIYDPNAATVVSIGLSSKTMSTSALAALANGQIGPAIEQYGGVSNVLVAGNVQAAYNVTVDPNALSGYGLTLTDIISTLSGNNLRAPGGIAYQPGRETQVDVRGDIDSPAAVAGLSVSSTSGGSTGGGNAPTLYGPSPYAGSLYGWTRPSQGVNIGDVARVEDSSVPVRNYAYINGIPGIELQVMKSQDASEIAVSDTVIKGLLRVPVAIVGAVFALLITHQTLNLYSLIGSLLLVGLVTKNGILLVDYANTLRRRVRPIIMTTMAMIAGMFPLALALEPGSQSRASLGAVVIGGLSSSLILTLFIVPIMYIWIAPNELAEPIRIGREKPNDERRREGPPGSGGQRTPQPAQ